MFDHRRPSPLALVLPLALLAVSLGCSPKDLAELGRSVVVRGTVTDAASGEPIDAVKVTLVSDASFPSRTTDARGLFSFDDVQRTDNLLVQFQKDGYRTVTTPVRCSTCAASGADGGSSGGGSPDGYDASVQLVRAYSVAVSGTVYSGSTLAKGAKVSLWTTNGAATPVIGSLAWDTTAGDDGRFSFPGVARGTYQLVVLPWDRDADGSTDTQFYGAILVVEPNGAANLGNVVVNLLDVQRALVASSFVALSKAYPISPADLTTGVTGILQATGGTIFLHFGAEVDPALTSFELVAVEPSGRVGPPIGLAVAWDQGSVAKLTPATNLVATADGTVGYELRVRALRFKDGTVGIAASPTAYGRIDFAVQQLPAPLASPTPAFYVGNQLTATQTAASAVVDDATVWLLDANGDFVFDTVAAANYSGTTGLQLTWAPVPGAVNYRVWARNTVSLGNGAAGTLDWRELIPTFLSPVQPAQTVPVLASVNPWTAGLGVGAGVTAGAPWRFGNSVQFAVTADDALGFRSPLDVSKLLTTKDDFGGLLTSVAVDPAGQPLPFAAVNERGATFAKTLKLSFSEPMNASVAPTLTSTGAWLTVKKVVSSAWGSVVPEPGSSSAQTAFVNLQLQSRMPCTELVLARAQGELIVPVRDAGLFAVSATNRVLFLDGSTGVFLAEVVGVGAVDAPANRLTLSAALPAAVANGSLVCSLAGANTSAFVSSVGTSVVVIDAKAFAVGQTVVIYEPQVGGAGQVLDLRTVAGVDTLTNTLVLNAAPAPTHTTASIVFSLTTGGTEAALRASTALTLTKDTAGGNDVDLFVSAPVTNVLVGDLVLVDQDGDLKTTVDQAQVKVKQVRFAPGAPPTVYSLVVDLPASFTLLRGRSTARALGDSFTVSGTRDTSAAAPKALDLHRDQFSGDGFLY